MVFASCVEPCLVNVRLRHSRRKLIANKVGHLIAGEAKQVARLCQ